MPPLQSQLPKTSNGASCPCVNLHLFIHKVFRGPPTGDHLADEELELRRHTQGPLSKQLSPKDSLQRTLSKGLLQCSREDWPSKSWESSSPGSQTGSWQDRWAGLREDTELQKWAKGHKMMHHGDLTRTHWEDEEKEFLGKIKWGTGKRSA